MATTLTADAPRFEAPSNVDTVEVAWAVIDSPIGPLVAAGTDDGLLMLSFSDPEATADELARTAVYRIDIESWSGKRKQAEPDFPGAFFYGQKPPISAT